MDNLSNYKGQSQKDRDLILSFISKIRIDKPEIVILDKCVSSETYGSSGLIVKPESSKTFDYIHGSMGIILKMFDFKDKESIPDEIKYYYNTYKVGDIILFNRLIPERILNDDLPPNGIWAIDIREIWGKKI